MGRTNLKMNIDQQVANSNVASAPDLASLAKKFGNDQTGLATHMLREFQQRPVDTADAVAAMMIEIRAVKKQLAAAQKIASTDQLTGLFNKTHLLSQISERRHITGDDYLLFIDLDGFKPINDTFGHAAGDAALKEVAKTLRRLTRSSDVVARLGGDEFGVALIGSTQKGAVKKQQAIQTLLTEGIPLSWDGQAILIRGTVGVCKIDPRLTAEQNLEASDGSMYEAKRAKGNTRFTLHLAKS